MIGTWLRGMAAVGALGVGSTAALGAGVAIPVAVHASVDSPDAPDDAEDAEDAEDDADGGGNRSCDRKRDNLGARVCGFHEQGLRGQELAAAIHADHAAHGRGPDAAQGRSADHGRSAEHAKQPKHAPKR